ncbi:hypothetical protein FB108_2698 [Brevibacterium jeotgali]|nr:hypothetical protein FB108_2698 [Brevibacterium jeotgali]
MGLIRITAGGFRLVDRRLTRIGRVRTANGLDVLTTRRC